MEEAMFRLIWQELKFRLKGILGWAAGLSLFPIIYVGIYPQVAEEMGGIADLEIYQAMGMSLGTFGGWVGSILLVFMPLIASIYAILNGTGTLAGEEEDGRLEMLVTLPLPRWQIVLAKAIALIISISVILAVVGVMSLIVLQSIESQIETEITGSDIAIAVIYLIPFVVSFGMISMFLAAFTAKKRIASGISILILIVGYFGSNLSASASFLEPYKPIFMFTYIDSSTTAILEGQPSSEIMILLSISLISLLLAVYFFAGRNLTTGQWPWQKRWK
jgi:ABC-2 type transport system permease protein